VDRGRPRRRALFPHEFIYKILRSGKLKKSYQIDAKNSWMVAACERNLPIIVPGWEDATLGNMYAAAVIRGDVRNVHTVRTGIEYMTWLAGYYTKNAKSCATGGLNRIFSDRRRHCRRFPNLRRPNAAPGSRAHRGAAVGIFLPNERFDDELRKLFWRRAERENHLGQACASTPKFVIESDATICAPLIFAWVLGQ
jgi:deoxyhypusine synthase